MKKGKTVIGLALVFFSQASFSADCESLMWDIDHAYEMVGMAEDNLYREIDRQAEFNDIRHGAESNPYGSALAAGFGNVYESDVRAAEARLREAQRDLQRAESIFNRSGCSSSGSTLRLR